MTPEQTKKFKYWQTRTIIVSMIGYALYYFVRKNFNTAMPSIEATFGITKTQLGIFLTLNGVIYGVSGSATKWPCSSRARPAAANTSRR